MRFFAQRSWTPESSFATQSTCFFLDSICEFVSANFLTQLGNAFVELRPLTFPPGAAHFELLALAVDRLGDVRIIDALYKVLGEFDAVGVVALGLLARRAGGILIQRLHHNRKTGTGLGVVKPGNNVAGADAVALLHQELADDAAGRMLDFFHI